ncbi:MAG: hypothetical protein JWM76_3216 [Pseudonocardiales bacterium]|nr:hypothetical protein [Pseudonocardiales bacterium]
MRRAAALVAVAVLLVSCSATTNGSGSPASRPVGSPSAGSTSSATAPGSPSGSCPSSYVEPDSKRPQTTLTFDIADDHRTVTGTEKISFTPDADITELVFRLTANTVPTHNVGNGIEVTEATADHGAGKATYDRAGAAPDTQGGLLRIPFSSKIKSGTTVKAELAFTLTIGTDSFDRFGSAGGFVWFASAHPLLAWERGYGWHTEPMIQFTAESATSEAAKTSLTVTAPAADVVLASGLPTDPGPAIGGRKTWHSTVDAARDVSVAAGPFVLNEAEMNGVKVRVGAPDAQGAAEVMSDEKLALTELGKRFGPFPFPTLSVALLPVPGGGIEYPSSILLLGSSRLVTVHETAHQYFYAMVGDSQAEHAWLDEAFASYAEQLVNNDAPPASDLDLPGPVDKPTADYGAQERLYYSITYDKGAAALHAARAAAGAEKFDVAMRCYVNANAWKIAEPRDLAAALKNLPAALAVLRKAGALT